MAYPIQPPIEPMLAKLQDEIPREEGWLYEPKWDGFRAIVYRDGAQTHIGSRNRLPLERYFPEVVEVLEDALPKRCVVDGEIVVARGGILDFDSLQMRLHPADSRVRLLAHQIPASFIAFDMLATARKDLRNDPMVKRRERLVTSITTGDRVLLTPQTEDPLVAEKWFERFEGAGLDGIIAKRRDQTYVPGKRMMVKVKHRRTADCVVGGYRRAKNDDGIGSLLLGLYDDDGVLHYVGHLASFKAAERREILRTLRSLKGKASFGEGRTPGGPSRWTGTKDLSWTAVPPKLVCEVSFDHMQGDRFRHVARFLRWRDDKDPADCTFEQLEEPRRVSIEEIRRLSEASSPGKG